MSYDISFKVKVEGVDEYVEVGKCDANITWNVGEMIRKSTGLEWVNEANNGFCKDVVPKIMKGLLELTENPEKYRQYESPNGWGTVHGTMRFFQDIITAWDDLINWHEEIADVATFWIE